MRAAPDTGAHVRLSPLPHSGPLAPEVPEPVLERAPVRSHERVSPEYWRLVLEAPTIAARAQMGQFAMLTIAREEDPSPVLPRPMALYGWDRSGGLIEIVYRVVGEGTRRLTAWQPGADMLAVGPLGRGFVIPPQAQRILLLGRGIGTCSLTALAQQAAERGVAVQAVVSARQPSALIGREAYAAAGASDVIEVVDVDGSSAVERLASRLDELCREGVDELYSCGSSRLLALAAEIGARHGSGVQVSLEAHMACGLGFCHGCAAGKVGLPHETPLVCADGPVFRWAPPSRSEA
jgi:dihydroorotate dehydrogenase electron transfer subunit